LNFDLENYRSGYIAIVGKPNVGKSTFLNLVLEDKISIISHKPQTTRNRILGVKTFEDSQMIFWDTPGFHFAKRELNKVLIRQIENTLKEVDVVLLISDASSPFGKSEKELIQLLNKYKKRVILVINKTDIVKKPGILKMIDKYSKIYKFSEIIPVSFLKNEGTDVLIDIIKQSLPVQPPFFPEDYLSDIPESFIVAERVREKIFQLIKEEIPYFTGVEVEQFREEEGKSIIYIQGTILVETRSQKKIIIGHNGSMIKKIGELARKDIEEFLNIKVYLDLWVKVLPKWTEKPSVIRRLGYEK